jgi:calcium permeable stress-gated cation channel
MVYLVYSVIAPLVSFVMAFCFVLLQILYRHQFVYIYPPRPDSGGKLWLNFISVVLNCMMIAQLTIIGLLTLKKSWASSFMIPLLVATVFFYIYLHDKHFVVAEYLPTRICLSRDLKHQAMDFSFTDDAYLQPEMKEPIGMYLM